MRFVGTESGITISMHPIDTLTSRFFEKHHATFGYVRENRKVEVVSLRCEAKLAPENAATESAGTEQHRQTRRNERTRFWWDGRWVDAELIDRESVAPGDVITGPAMIASDQSTLLIEPHWQGAVLEGCTIELRPTETNHRDRVDANDAERDPVLLEVLARRLQGIADAMGEVLRRTAVSVNVKERCDYSCAVFRGDGSLIANAPHVPVHLGAMGHTVRRMIEHVESMSAGDCYLSNDPFAGGSHLPDVTVVTPVFCQVSQQSRGRREKAKPDFFVASRAHHAEIGGRTPGSMPPDATSLAEEGVLLRRFTLVKDGVNFEDDLRKTLSSGPYPSRNVRENLADVAAQHAAGVYGVKALRDLADSYSVATIDAFMGRLLDVAGQGIANWIEQLPTTPMRFEDALDDGSPIVVCLQRNGDRISIDFSGTAPVHPRGFNATPSIVTAAVLYVLRCVSGSNLPLCDGVLRQVDLKIPVGMLNPPGHDDPNKCAAVVAGNVETSQRIVDVLLGALGVAAASQGTMNNLLIGNETFGYYETIGGGSGATPDADGADAVHTHMTNTLITDPEVMESRLPIRLHRFQVRADSGGKGKHRGGNGIIRELEFLERLTVSLITGRRTRPPYGAAGGEPGKCGVNQWIHEGQTSELPPSTSLEASAGDRLIIRTPGGGGWGISTE
jgi:5-oxoprolinase (ATP-hydrolysing)